MQNNALLYGIGALVVIAAGVGIWMYGGGSMMGDGNGNAKTQSTNLKSLIASQSPQRCTFSNEGMTEGASSSGTVYVAGGKMRGDFVSTAGGHTSNSHMVVEGGASYVWTDEMAQGFKMSFDAMSQPQNNNAQTVDPNADVDYSCSYWGVDSSVFVLPTNITFQDMSAMMPPAAVDGEGSVQTSNSSQCAACDQAPNESTRAQCRAALQCQ